MSFFSWLFPSANAGLPVPDSSGLSRLETTRPVDRRNGPPSDNAQPANRKSERMARRELLYGVVRNAMTQSGVQSSSYKFKVLSLEARGRQFLIMVDLARDQQAETVRLAEIEALIAQCAKLQHDILVTAVYWRMSEHVAVGDPLAVRPPAAGQEKHRFEPIGLDEVEAFKKALIEAGADPQVGAIAPAPAVKEPTQSVSGPATAAAHGATAKAFDGSDRHGPQSYTLLTGFEDTESEEETRIPALSRTQYGDVA